MTLKQQEIAAWGSVIKLLRGRDRTYTPAWICLGIEYAKYEFSQTIVKRMYARTDRERKRLWPKKWNDHLYFWDLNHAGTKKRIAVCRRFIRQLQAEK